MKYHCGHNACDICGGRTCMGISLRNSGILLVCPACEKMAIHIAYDMSCRFGGTIIDLAKPCGDKEVRDEAKKTNPL